jgi:hypothetical protein
MEEGVRTECEAREEAPASEAIGGAVRLHVTKNSSFFKSKA